LSGNPSPLGVLDAAAENRRRLVLGRVTGIADLYFLQGC
jgi:hypothetical protein